MMNRTKKNGFTLIETLIYIALFTLMMGGAVVAAFFIIDASAHDKDKITATLEAEFLMRKIDWALTGLDLSSPVNVPAPGASGPKLSVNKNGFPPNPLVVDAVSGRARLAQGGGAAAELTTDRVAVSNLKFRHIAALPPMPAAIVTSFTIAGRDFQMTKYLRK